MKRTDLIAAVLLAAFTAPALAQDQPGASPPAPQQQRKQIELDVEQSDSTTSRAITRDELERLGIDDLIREFEGDWLQAVQAEAKPREFVRGPFLGVNAKPLAIEAANELGLKRGTGLRVTYVASSGPAWNAGLRKDTVLTKLNDQVLINAEQFAVLVRSQAIGDAVTLHGLRDGKPIKLEAKLGEADISLLGPGGKDLDHTWRLQFSPMGSPAGNPLRPEFEIAPGVWIGDGWGDLSRLPANPEQMPEKLRDKIKELEQQMFQQHQQMQQQMRRLCVALNLDPDQLRQQAKRVTRMQSAIIKSDGEHRIAIQYKDRVPHCNIQDKAGNVLFDGPLPANGVIKDLPKEVQLKLQTILSVPDELHLGEGVEALQQLAPPVLPAPDTTNRQALTKTLAALEQLEKNHQNIIFDPWHGSDLDLAMLRERLGLEDKTLEKKFDREALIEAIEAIYAKSAGNSEMQSVLAQIGVREAIKDDLGAIGKTYGENRAARARVNKLIQRVNGDLLVQHNDEKHSIRLEGVGLLQRLTIKDRNTGETLYSGFARTSTGFLSGKTDNPGIKELERLPKAVQDKVKKMLSDKQVRRYLSDGC